MPKPTIISVLCAAVLIGSACAAQPDTTPAPKETATAVAPPALTAVPESGAPGGGMVINEIMAGAPGNNNPDFVELVNTGAEPLDLAGWTLVYRLPSAAPRIRSRPDDCRFYQPRVTRRVAFSAG